MLRAYVSGATEIPCSRDHIAPYTSNVHESNDVHRGISFTAAASSQKREWLIEQEILLHPWLLPPDHNLPKFSAGGL
jgi:hypothetical protein